MNFYFYVYSGNGKGRFLAATVNEAHAIDAVAKALAIVYRDWNQVKVYRDHPFKNNDVPLYVYDIGTLFAGIRQIG